MGTNQRLHRGKYDLFSQRPIDILQSIPTLALVIVASMGSSLNNIVIAISIGLIATSARVVRSSAIVIRNMDYILAAVAMGASWRRIVFSHVMPNSFAPYLIVATASPVMGQDAIGDWKGLLPNRAVDVPGSRTGHRPCGVDLQPVRGRPERYT